MLLQSCFVMGGELRGQLRIQGATFLGWAARNGFGRHGARFPALTQVAFDRGQRDLEHHHDLLARGALIDSMQDALTEVGGIGSHAPSLTLGLTFLQTAVDPTTGQG